MCEIVEEFAREYAKEVEENMVKKLLKSGTPIEKILNAVEILTKEEVLKLVE